MFCHFNVIWNKPPGQMMIFGNCLVWTKQHYSNSAVVVAQLAEWQNLRSAVQILTSTINYIESICQLPSRKDKKEKEVGNGPLKNISLNIGSGHFSSLSWVKIQHWLVFFKVLFSRQSFHDYFSLTAGDVNDQALIHEGSKSTMR